MCGIAGLLGPPGRDDDLRTIARAMAGTLRHRGPDAGGAWVDASAGIALGHRRLSIVDVSDAGAQPMASASSRYVLSFNGEIYNAPALGEELRAKGHWFRGHSDTEVLVEAIDAWGLEATLPRLNGMFAIALWDRDQRRLQLARDRLGEKPLYYGWTGATFVFGSELRALKAHPAFRAEVDRDALALYLRFNCVPAPWSIYAGVRKLPVASVLTVDPAASDPSDAQPVPYWSAVTAFDATRSRFASEMDAVDALDELLRDATRIRMRSDVPLGAFLSGGIDSSTVVALMQQESADAVRTFTIGNTARTFDEAGRAAAVAEHLGTTHSELIVTDADAWALIPELPNVYDEPFADSSQLPTLLVSELARRSVTVSLSGDGGDELFGGYDRYRWVPRVARGAGRAPASRRALARAILAVPPGAWNVVARPLPERLRPRIPATKLAKLASIAPLESAEAMHRQLLSHWDHPDSVVVGSHEPAPTPLPPWSNGESGREVERMMALDLVTYLPDDILVKLDRATMSVGLEGRVPLLDHRVVELAAALPLELKIRDGQSKWLLRQVLSRYVPARLFTRPKAGFGVPIGAWLRGSLRPWAEELLRADRLRSEGYLRPEPVRSMWEQHLARTRDCEYHLWDVLMFQAWLEHAGV